jgi:integrase
VGRAIAEGCFAPKVYEDLALIVGCGHHAQWTTIQPGVVIGWACSLEAFRRNRFGQRHHPTASVAVRGFYDYLVEEEIRERNPVRRGQSGRRGGRPQQGLVRRVEKAPWIPNESAWDRILTACEVEPLRNLLMVATAYDDGALRRQELVQLDVDDLEPAWSLIHLRAETTKSKRARDVSRHIETAAGRLHAAA